jgi:hypothetical protein
VALGRRFAVFRVDFFDISKKLVADYKNFFKITARGYRITKNLCELLVVILYRFLR